MRAYSQVTKFDAIELRKKGYTSKEISNILGLSIPKSTYSGWFREVEVTGEGRVRLSNYVASKLNRAREMAVAKNKYIRKKFLSSLDDENRNLAKKVKDIAYAKIALSMLCLGEASKHKSGSAFSLGNTDHRIIILFIKLLEKCFEIDRTKFRCTVMCRADQDILKLERYWQRITRIPKTQFYKARVDKRSEGKKTKRSNYMGVLKVDYMDTKVQLTLESLAELIYNQVA